VLLIAKVPLFAMPLTVPLTLLESALLSRVIVPSFDLTGFFCTR
jgi:hypothetical protein